MERPEIEQWLVAAKSGNLSWTELAERLLALESQVDEFDHPDRDRQRRCGFGEVIFGQSKSAETIVSIANRLLSSSPDRDVLVTRCDAELVPRIVGGFGFSRYDVLANTLRLGHHPLPRPQAPMENETFVAVVTAGSTDLSVAREAVETLHWMRIPVTLISDVGVAGPYRLLPHLPMLRQASAIVVCAGMEGALASVVGGLVASPIIAVPTSVGYGANLAGITTLLSMISSCAAGVTVVNIDAGFKGGYVAGLIANRKTGDSVK